MRSTTFRRRFALPTLIFCFSVLFLDAQFSHAETQQLSSPAHKVDGFRMSDDEATALYSTENSGLFAVPTSGGSVVNLTTENNIWSFATTNNSNHVIYTTTEGGSLHSVPIDGGEIKTLHDIADDKRIWLHTISDDSRYVVFWLGNRSDPMIDGELYSVPVTGGQPVHLTSIIPDGYSLIYYRVSSDSRRIVFTSANSSSGFPSKSYLYSIPIEGGAPVLLDALDSNHENTFNTYVFQITDDSSTVVYMRELYSTSSSTDVETIETGLFSIPIVGGQKTEIERTAPDDPEILSDFHLLREGKVAYGLADITYTRFGSIYSGDIYSARLTGENRTKLNTNTLHNFKFIIPDGQSSQIFLFDFPSYTNPFTENYLYSIDFTNGKSNLLMSIQGFINGIYTSDSLKNLYVHAHEVYINGSDLIYYPKIFSLPPQGGAVRTMDSDMQDTFSWADDETKLVYTKRNLLYCLPLPTGPSVQISSVQQGNVDEFAVLQDTNQVVYSAGNKLYIGPVERASHPMIPGTMQLLLDEK